MLCLHDRRQVHLMRTFGFRCACERCARPPDMPREDMLVASIGDYVDLSVWAFSKQFMLESLQDLAASIIRGEMPKTLKYVDELESSWRGRRQQQESGAGSPAEEYTVCDWRVAKGCHLFRHISCYCVCDAHHQRHKNTKESQGGAKLPNCGFA